MPERNTTGDQDPLADLLREKIENLRPKLLDLSRRNPLISTNLSNRSASIVRVVDELPDVLFSRISAAQKMRFVSLPPLEDDPRDEQTSKFQDALSAARILDEQFVLEMDQLAKIDRENVDAEIRKAERALRDRVRDQLGMSPHSMVGEVSISQHARNNDISPSLTILTTNVTLDRSTYPFNH